MSCLPRRPCKSQSPSAFHEYLHKARDVCYWLGHINDPPSPTDEFDDWLMTANLGAPQSHDGGDGGGGGGGGGGGAVGGQTCPFVDAFLYMVLKARQAAAATAMIMLGAMVIALRSAQFISGRWSQTTRANCTNVHLYFQATILCALNVFVLFAVYWPAYHAFLNITGVVVWIITALKAAALSIFIIFL